MSNFMSLMSQEIVKAVKKGVVKEMKSINHEKRESQPKVMGIN